MASTLKNVIVLWTVYSSLALTCIWQGDFVLGESEKIMEDNWEMILKGQWMIKFYAPWCPACRNLRPIWDKFAIQAETLNVRVAEVDVTKNTALSGRFGIVSLPTVYHAINGEFRLYQEKRKVDELVAFIEEKKWESVDPIPSWKSPGSFLMRGMGAIFKAAVVLKDIHTVLTETYGLPAWGSYIMFGVGTVLVGLILGMILVFLSDCLIGVLWPAPVYKAPVVEGNDAIEGTEEGAKDEPAEEATKEELVDGGADQDSTETANVRKRGKKLKATME